MHINKYILLMYLSMFQFDILVHSAVEHDNSVRVPVSGRRYNRGKSFARYAYCTLRSRVVINNTSDHVIQL